MKKKVLLFIVLFIILAGVTQAYSLDSSYRPVNSPFDLKFGGGDKAPVTNTIFILQMLAGALLYFAGPIAIIMIIASGLKMIIGGAESEKLDEGKKSLTWSVIGLVVIILSYSIVRIILSIIIRSASAV